MKVINPNNLPVAPISEFIETQGELKFLSKENYNKLKNNIERRGFDLPIYVWIDEDGKKWLLDGHQRKHVLMTEGWNKPIPYLVIKAKDKAEAAERLLEITSQFGTITQEGIDEYIAKFELPELDVLSHTNFDGIFNFSVEEPPTVEPEPELEIEETFDPVSEMGKIYALGRSRLACGPAKEGEFPPDKMDAFRKKYHRTVTGSEIGWEDGTPEAEV